MTTRCSANNRTDNYYQWTNNPTGQVHTVARVRFNSALRRANAASAARRSPTTRSPASRATPTPRSRSCERALSWCRDIQSGRSFYTGMGQTAGAYDDALRKHLACAIQWAAGMVRGDCKATINSNYTTRA